MDRDVKVHTCHQKTEIRDIKYLNPAKFYYSDDPKFKSFKALPTKCECKKKVTRERADVLVEQGTALKVYKPKDLRPLNDNRVDRFQVVMVVNRNQTPRVDLITRADIERAYDHMSHPSEQDSKYIQYIEEIHAMIMSDCAKLMAPFRPDPQEGRLLFPFSKDLRTGH